MQRALRGSGRGGDNLSTTIAWSDWTWNDCYNCNYRYRQNRVGEWEYEYGPVQATYDPTENSADVTESFGNLRVSEEVDSDQHWASQDTQSNTDSASQIPNDPFPIPCTWPSCSEAFKRESDRDRHYQTIHANNGDRPYRCPIDGCTANVRSWARADKLRAHNRTWHGPYHCQVFGCSRAFPCGLRSQQDLDGHTLEAHSGKTHFASGDTPSMFGKGKETENYSYSSSQPTVSSARPRSNASYTPLPSSIPSNEPRWIFTRNPATKADKADKRFKVHRSKEFSFGKVFKVLWSEPTGSGGTEITERGARECKDGIFQKQRRFVIVDTRKGHSICLPIMTYGGQGTLKYGVHPEDHAAIYSSKRDGPYIPDQENLTNEAIRVEVIDPTHKLDPMSRLNYAKLYTVEHNVKVFFIGKVAKNFEQKLVDAYNYTHQPLPDRPDQTAETTDDTFQHAEGQDPNYPQATDQSSSSWTGDSSTEPLPNNYHNSYDQSSSSWTGDSSTEPLPNNYHNSYDQYDPNLYDADE